MEDQNVVIMKIQILLLNRNRRHFSHNVKSDFSLGMPSGPPIKTLNGRIAGTSYEKREGTTYRSAGTSYGFLWNAKRNKL